MPKLIRIRFKHQHETAVTVAQFTEHEITRPEVWCFTYVHPSMTINRPAKKSPLGSDHASSSLSSLYVSMLLLNKLMSATAVKEAQTTAANPVISTETLYSAVNIVVP